jgi:hypothetical protein
MLFPVLVAVSCYAFVNWRGAFFILTGLMVRVLPFALPLLQLREFLGTGPLSVFSDEFVGFVFLCLVPLAPVQNALRRLTQDFAEGPIVLLLCELGARWYLCQLAFSTGDLRRVTLLALHTYVAFLKQDAEFWVDMVQYIVLGPAAPWAQIQQGSALFFFFCCERCSSVVP